MALIPKQMERNNKRTLQCLSSGHISSFNIFLSEKVKGKEEIKHEVQSRDNTR